MKTEILFLYEGEGLCDIFIVKDPNDIEIARAKRVAKDSGLTLISPQWAELELMRQEISFLFIENYPELVKSIESWRSALSAT